MDALIFGDTGPIQHVSFPDVNFEALTELTSNMVLKEPANASAAQWHNFTTRFLKPTLRMVWNKILIPVFDKMHVPLVASAALP